MHKHYRLLLLLLALALVLGACAFSGEDDNAASTPTVELPTPANTPARPVNGEPFRETTSTQPLITFTVWTVPDISPRTEVPGGSALLEQLEAFDASHPDLELFVELKNVSGQGGMLSYLRTGRTIAPSILPDMLLLPSNQLNTAARESLIYPLDNLPIDDEHFDDLYPAARQLVTIDGSIYGYPIALTNLHHLAYHSTAITETIPSTWNAFIDLNHTAPSGFIFPAAGPAGGTLLLQFYLAHGGRLADDSGAARLDLDPLTAALSDLARAGSNGFLSTLSTDTNALAESWQLFQDGAAGSTLTDVEQYLNQRSLLQDSAFAPLPGPTTPFSPTVTAWAWAITTPDPARQALAAELISWLGSAANQGEWSAQSRRLPARRTALEAWPADDPYTAFINGLAESAQPYPAQASGTILSALNAAAVAVIESGMTPQQAAQEAIDAINP